MNLNFAYEDFNELDSFPLFNDSDIFMDETDKEAPNLYNALGVVSESYNEDLIANNNEFEDNLKDQALLMEASLEECSFSPVSNDLDFFLTSVDLLQGVSSFSVAKHEGSDDLGKSIVNLNSKSATDNKKNVKKMTTHKSEKQKKQIVMGKELNSLSDSNTTISAPQFKEPKSHKASNTGRVTTRSNNKKATRLRTTTRSTRSRSAKCNRKKSNQSTTATNDPKGTCVPTLSEKKKSNRPSDISMAFDLSSDFSQQILSMEDLDWVLEEAKKFLKRHSAIPESVMKEDEKVLLRKMSKSELENLSNEQKLQRKRARDRVCARNSRNKKKKYTDFLEKQANIIKTENGKVEKQLEGLLDENQRLKNEISQLQSRCAVGNKN
ncbi:activating transcription factor-2 [Anaeramoeba flamelloides]|uniref:Activating transcription factor-2 n=1 Tax=Anaeramoeba flamelloides TaxID=1746091 RepID=A0ABQ8Y510_9EUKA|nr:activating transcription factor-2 [Anaeramoeba flamelloides]